MCHVVEGFLIKPSENIKDSLRKLLAQISKFTSQVMPSDSSDDDHDDVHFMDYPDCVEEDENQSVGLIVEDFKFSRSDKGKITTNHVTLGYCRTIHTERFTYTYNELMKKKLDLISGFFSPLRR